MKTDEVLREVHEHRDGYVKEHGSDIDTVFSDLKERQRHSQRKIVDLAEQKKAEKSRMP